MAGLGRPLYFRTIDPFETARRFPRRRRFEGLGKTTIFVGRFELGVVIVLRGQPTSVNSLFGLIGRLHPNSKCRSDHNFPANYDLVDLFGLFDLYL